MSNLEAKIMSWWKRNLDRETPSGRGLSARLRRASAVEVLTEPAVHELAQDLNVRSTDRVVRLATLLAEVREHSKQTLAHRLGGPEPVMSNLRFQKLIRASEAEWTDGLRRAIKMAGNTCNVGSLGADILFLNDKIKADWCFQYFNSDVPQDNQKETVK